MTNNCIRFSINGQKYKVDNSLPLDTPLATYLRYVASLPGTKIMCREGGCGVCIVQVRAKRETSGRVETFSVNSCLVLVFSCHDWDITTVEGVGNRRDGYSEVQTRIAAFNGTQCGFCTPGWVMQMHSLLDKSLTMAELEKSFGSNTCRCTGYRPLLDVIRSFGTDAPSKVLQQNHDIEDIPVCAKSKSACNNSCSESVDSGWSLLNDEQIIKKTDVVKIDFSDHKFFKVFDEEQIFDVLKEEGDESYMLVDGNTAKGIYGNYEYPRVLIDISNVNSLKTYEFDQNLILGANMALQDALMLFKDTAKDRDEFFYLEEFAEHFEVMAHLPVRKIGSVAGNLMIKHGMPSYQSDVFLLFESVGAMVTVRDAAGDKTTMTMLEFLKYNMKGMLMINVELPPFSKSHIFKRYKVMPRNQNALAIMNAAFLVKICQDTNTVIKASIVYGNISSTFYHARRTEHYLREKNLFNNETLQGAIKLLNEEIVPEYNPLGIESSECRKKLALGIFYKFVVNISDIDIVCPRYLSGGSRIERPLSSSLQDFQTQPKLYPLTQPVPKLEALIQTSGEAKYANDIPPLKREVFAAFVLSTVHDGEIDSIDATDVLKKEGVIALYTANDIPGTNTYIVPGSFNAAVENIEILASSKIFFFGQPVAVLVADKENLVIKESRNVKVTYKNNSNKNPVLNIKEAKTDEKRVIPNDNSIDPTSRGTDIKKIIKGIYETKHQYHYYTEPITCVVVPTENGIMIYDSTQAVAVSQMAIASALNIKESDIIFEIRRVGGGFGGKLSSSCRIATSCALVATKLDVPCRFILPIQTNLTIVGKRSQKQTEYEVGTNDIGKIQYLNAKVIEEKGHTNNETFLQYFVDSFDNCYVKDSWDVKSVAVLTDLPTTCAMRGPGTFSAINCIEHIMEHIAFVVKRDPIEVRLSNMRVEDNDLPEMIEIIKKDADYNKRSKIIEEFNKSNRWMKKDIRISIMAYPLYFTESCHVLVSIYKGDGSVSICSGGIDMGQGLNTKAAQVCAYCLGIPLEKVSIIPSNSFVCANDKITTGSTTTESICFAVIKACEILNKRLAPIKSSMDNPSWEDVIKQAGIEFIDLTADYMFSEKTTELENYSTFSVGILEVQLDVLLGRYELLRVDILEDVGVSASPFIDIGQVEGAYVQTLGFFMSEKLVYDEKSGRLLNNRSLTYHVPLALDIPADFRVKLRYNSKNPKGVLGSKAVGEMSTGISHGVSLALRQCIMESRSESGYDPDTWIEIDIPHDTESTLKALDIKLEEFVLQ